MTQICLIFSRASPKIIPEDRSPRYEPFAQYIHNSNLSRICAIHHLTSFNANLWYYCGCSLNSILSLISPIETIALPIAFVIYYSKEMGKIALMKKVNSNFKINIILLFFFQASCESHAAWAQQEPLSIPRPQRRSRRWEGPHCW